MMRTIQMAAPIAAATQAQRARSAWRVPLPFVAVFAVALILPLVGNDYWAVIATRAAVYWVLVAGLNLVVGFGGQFAIGSVALLTLGAYTTSILVSGNLIPEVPLIPAFAAAGVVGALAGVVVGLPALRLGTFYFAMVTVGFAIMVTQVAVAWHDVTGGPVGVAGPVMPPPFSTPWGFYLLCLAIAAAVTWMTANVAHSRFGRSLIAIRDAEVLADSVGISKPRLLILVFLLGGVTSGLSGALFATLQSYITPDAFTLDLSVLFFVAVLIGGRGSIIGPLLGTILLTVLPALAAPLVAWSTFLYAALLLLIVLAMPGGIAEALDFRNRKPLPDNRTVVPRTALLSELLDRPPAADPLHVRDLVLQFGAMRALDGISLTIRPGEVHGLIGPNGSGKTTTLNVISGFNSPDAGTVTLGEQKLRNGAACARAAVGVARTFQTPRVIGEASVLQNVMVGGSIAGHAGLVESLLCLPRHLRDEAMLRHRAMLALRTVGLDDLADARADRLQHTELRFVEIARALMLRPAFLLLDEPAAGLSVDETKRLGALITGISRCGVAVLLVEHHADLIFEICQRITVLNLGRELASGTAAEIRAHKEVVSAYLGA